MSDGNQPPFRMPCEAIAGKPLFFFGPPFQHDLTPATADKYVNVTLVPNPAGGAGISPYERYTQDFSGGDSCEVHHCNPDGAPCAAWSYPYPENVFAHTPGDNVNFAATRKQGFKNVQAKRFWQGCFGWVSGQVNCSTNFCSDGVTSYRAYQPIAEQTKYLTVTYDIHVDNHFDAGEAAGGYLKADKTGSRTVNAQTGEITSTLSTSEEQAANFGSGAVITKHLENGAGYFADETGTHTSDFSSGGSTILDSLEADLHCVFPHFRADADFDLPGFIAAWNAQHATPMPLMTDPNNYSCTITSSDPDGNWTIDATFTRSATIVSWHFTATQNNGSDEDNTWEYWGGITLSNPNTSASVYADIKNNLLSIWPLNDDKLYPWRTDLKVSVAPLVSRNERGPISPLGFNTYTVDDLSSPIKDESGNTPFSPGWTPTYDQRAWFDPDCYEWVFSAGMNADNSAATGLQLLFDGSIKGGPKPAGHQNFFNFGYIDIAGCCFTDPLTESKSWAWYQLGWGMDAGTFNANSGCQLPLNATQWNNYLEAVNKPIGAWIFYADQGQNYVPADCPGTASAGDASYLVVCKWAECLESWFSPNFASPAGDMKFWFDENHVFCAVNTAGLGPGSTWALTDPLTGIAPPDGTDFTGIWGGPIVGGFYNVSSYSTGTLTLGAKVYDLPSNWASKSNGDEAYCFGKVRFPNSPSLLGRIGVTPNTDGTTFTFGSTQPDFGMNSNTHQEQVDLFDESMMEIANNITATRVDDSTFTTAADYVTAKYAMIHGAAKWYVNDTNPKGDYAVLEWVSDFRSAGEFGRLNGVLDCDGNQVLQPTTNAGGGPVTQPFANFTQTAGCLPFVPCSPKVVCISPNGETFPNGKTFDFPNSFSCDEHYGSKWWGFVQSTMTDLFWQQPHRPCNIKPCAKWLMDGGTCAEDSVEDGIAFACSGDEGFIDGESQPPVYYYAHAPQVEARLTVPCNYGIAQNECAPALPADVQIGWLSPVFYSTGDVALPPNPPGPLADRGEPAGASTTWDFHRLLCGQMQLGCRFRYQVPGC